MPSSLIGTDGWNPNGESFLSIVRRIAHINHFDANEIGEIFGSKGKSTLSTVRRSDPDNTLGIEPARVVAYTGWQADTLLNSFSRSYIWKSGYQEPHLTINRYESNGYMSDQIKLCVDCAVNQKHYIFHQLRGWIRCPIHQTELVTICPRCSTDFGKYWFDKKEFHLATLCQVCGWGLPDHHKIESSDNRIIDSLIIEYQNWIRIVDEAVVGTHPEFVILNQLDARKDIECIQELIPGPAWLQECVDTGIRKRTETFRMKNFEYTHRPSASIKSLPDEIYRADSSLVGSLILRMSFRTRELTKSITKELYGLAQAGENWNIEDMPYRTSSLADELLCVNSIRSRCLSYWLEKLKYYVPYFPDLDFNTIDKSKGVLLDNAQYLYWRSAGPGKIVWYDSKEGWVNSELMHLLSNYWWRMQLLELYFISWVRTILEKEPSTFTSIQDSLDADLSIVKYRLVDHSLYMVRQVSDGVEVVRVGSFCETDKLLKYIHSRAADAYIADNRKQELDLIVLDLIGTSETLLNKGDNKNL